MQKINVRFPNNTAVRVGRMSAALDGKVTASEIARAAMEIGLKQIDEAIDYNLQIIDRSVPQIVHINNIRAMLADKE